MVHTPISVNDASELASYIFFVDRRPTKITDTSNYIKKGHDKIGGYEFAGPCPKCGGTDRFIISNGAYWCRKQCGCNGALIEDRGSVSPHNYIERFLSPKINVSEIQKEQEAKKNETIEKLNKYKTWIKFQRFLLNSKQHMEIMDTQGLDTEVRSRFQLGLNPEFRYKLDKDSKDYIIGPAWTIPIFEWQTGKCINIRHRIFGDVPKGDRYRPMYSRLGIYFLLADRHDTIDDNSYLIIVEGEKKAMVLWKYGFNAVGLFGIQSRRDEWIDLWREKYQTLYVLFDEDSEETISIAKLWSRRIGAKRISLHGKPDDALLQGALSSVTFRNLLREAKRGV